MGWRRWVVVTGLAVVATFASTLVDGQVIAVYPDIMGCETGCPTAAAGWPALYLVDYPGISPVGSVSLIEGFGDGDIIWWGAFAVCFLFWLGLSALLLVLARRGAGRWRRCGD